MAPVVNRLLSMRRIVVAEHVANSTIAAYVFVPSIYVLLASSVLVSFFIPAGNAAIIGYRTAVTPDRLIGRVSSVSRGIALARSRSGLSSRACCSPPRLRAGRSSSSQR